MKTIFLVMLLTLASCGKKEEGNYFPVGVKRTEAIKLDVFSLAYHTTLGNCETQPIRHRFLTFAPIYLEKSGDDIFIGVLDVLLDSTTNAYQAVYKEYPAQGNPDQTIFEKTLSGNFHVVQSASEDINDKLILQGVGTVDPIIKSNKVNFLIHLDFDQNRPIIERNVDGSVVFRSTALVSDNCLF